MNIAPLIGDSRTNLSTKFAYPTNPGNSVCKKQFIGILKVFNPERFSKTMYPSCGQNLSK